MEGIAGFEPEGNPNWLLITRSTFSLADGWLSLCSDVCGKEAALKLKDEMSKEVPFSGYIAQV